MNFQNVWDVGWCWNLRDMVVTSEDGNRNMNTLRNMLVGWPGLHRVLFSEAHDDIARNHDRSRIPIEIHLADDDVYFYRLGTALVAE